MAKFNCQHSLTSLCARGHYVQKYNFQFSCNQKKSEQSNFILVAFNEFFNSVCSYVANKNVPFNNKHPPGINRSVEKRIKLSKNQFPNILALRFIKNI